MSTRKQFRYYLKANDTTYYYVSNGVVQTTTTPTPIEADPVEWKETDLRWMRNAKYHGIFRSFVIPMTFTKDAATILRYIFYSQAGIESICILQIDRKKVKTSTDLSDETYENYYTGDIDFSEKHDDDLHFQVNVLDRGLAALIKAYESTIQEIPIEEADCLKVYMDGLRLKNASILTLANDLLSSSTSHQMMPVIAIIQNESDVQVDVIEQPIQQVLGAPTIVSAHPFFKATIAGTVSIEFDINLLITAVSGQSYAVSGFDMVITRRTPGGVNTGFSIFSIPQGTNFLGNRTATGIINIPVGVGDTLSYHAGLTPFTTGGTSGPLADQLYSYSTLKVHYDLKLPDTIIRAYRYYQLWQKLIAKITGGLYTGVSNFLSNPANITIDTKPWNTLVTNGNALRGLGRDAVTIPVFGGIPLTLPADWAKIKTTLEELNQDALSSWMAGIGVEGNVARLEHLSYFYDNNSVTLELEDLVSGLQIEVALEHIHNELKIGIANQDYDNLNGKDEPNTTHIYSFPIIRKKEAWDMVSPYRDDQYGIEFQRSQLLGKDTTDAASDSDTFIIEVDDTPTTKSITVLGHQVSAPVVYTLARRQNTAGNTATGLIAADAAFNLGRTPKHKFFRIAPLIHTSVHQQEGKIITFQTTDKNADVQTSLGSGLIVEKANVPVSNLTAPLFLPILFSFETKVPKDLATIMSANPYGRINFSFKDKRGKVHTLGGFVDEVSMKPADNATCTWKLLACPDVNITDLIYR